MSDTYTGTIDPTLSLTSQTAQFFPDNNDRQGTLVEISSLPAGASVDNIFYFNSSTAGKYLRRVIDGPIRAAYCGIYGDGTDQTAKINAAIAHADIMEIVFDYSGGADILISGTVSIPAGKKLTFKSGNKLTGSGTVSGGIISGDPDEQILANTVNLSGVRTPDNIFYAAWYGAKGDNSTDNITMLQKAADYICTNSVNVKILQLGGGTYKISKGLIFYSKTGNEYNQINFILRGTITSQIMVDGSETVLQLTTHDTFCLGIQEAKGCLVENIGLKGTNQLAYTIAQVFNPTSSFIAGSQRDNRYSPYAGLVLDPFGANTAAPDQYPGFEDFYTNQSNGGSTTCTFKNIHIDSFIVGVVMSPNVTTRNNEGHHFDHIWLSSLREGIVTCSSQERTVKCTNINCWGQTKILFANNVYGLQRGDPPMIDVVNVAGGIYQFCFLYAGLGSVNISIANVYCESLYRIGFASGTNVTFTRCQFKLYDVTAPNPGLKLPVNIYNCGIYKTLFIGCTIMYFTDATRYPLNMNGNIKFFNCYLNQQIGIQYVVNTIFNNPGYERVDFYTGGPSTGFITDGNLLSTSNNYRFSGQGSTNHCIQYGTEITTFGGGTAATLSDTWKAKQVRKCLSPLVKRILLGTNIAVTVTNNTATATIPALAGITAYNNYLVYSNSFTYSSDAIAGISGAQIMRLTSINGSGVCSFDRLVEGLTSGNYNLYLEQFTRVDAPIVADISGTSLTNVTEEVSGTATLFNGGLYFIYGNAPVIVTSSSPGVATINANTTGEGSRVILCEFEYEESGFSESDPLTNTFFTSGTLFSKGAFYKKINGVSGVIGWICTKSGVKGTSVLPEFTEVLPGNAEPLRSVNGDQTLTFNDNTILVDTGTGNKTITVNAALRKGDYTIVKTSSDSNTVTISPLTGSISGSASVVLNAQYQSVTIRSDLTHFFITAQI